MTRKLNINIRLSAALMICAAILVNSCKKGGNDLELNATVNSLDFAASGETKTFDVKSNTDWTISGTEWLTISPTSDKGNVTVSVTAAVNAKAESRNADIILTANGAPAVKVSITQQAGLSLQEVIPKEIYEEFKEKMPLYSGATPPDISGEYLASPLELKASNNADDRIGRTYADSYVAFTKNISGKLSYSARESTSQKESEDIIVVGEGNNFTAYFIASVVRPDASSKQATLISGKITAGGITDYHYAFIMLEKDDPKNNLVDVNIYRIFVDGDGLAEKRSWISTTAVQSSQSIHSAGESSCAACQ